MEAPYPPEAGLPEGTLLFAQFRLAGYLFNAMSSTRPEEFDFSPGNSIVVECETQAEIDHYWEKLGKDGRYEQCGWLQDEFGISWQVVPKILSKLMADPERSKRVIDAFLKMKKFDIQQLLDA
jgi:predicted 3-demethylubiquinone-9 3-methyltransferase (glyoxalase superfamily)